MSLPASQPGSPPQDTQHAVSWLRFVAGYGALGIALATVLVWLNPGWLTPAPSDLSPTPSGLYQPSPSANLPGPATPMRPPIADDGPPLASYAAAVEQAAPAVVNIYAAIDLSEHYPGSGLQHQPLERFFDSPRPPHIPGPRTNLGSGVIVSAAGHVITNHHVIERADHIQVMLADGREAEARVVGRDPETDLAILKIALDHLPVITFGSEEPMQVGDVVLAIGNPYGVGQTVTQGIISATGRDRLGLSTFEHFLQTDAAIHIGNSGGALIDSRGRLVGINTAVFNGGHGSYGIGFAIPAAMAQAVMNDLLEHGRVVRGWLGIRAQRLTPPLARSFGVTRSDGVIVTETVRGGPAADGTLRSGDIITHIDGHRISDVQDLLTITSHATPGTSVKVRGYRDGEAFTTPVTLGERPPSETNEGALPGSGRSPLDDLR